MKRILLILILSSCSSLSITLFSQIDFKVDPTAFVFKNLKTGFEFGVNDLFALDIDFTYSSSVSIPFQNFDFTAGKSYGYRIVGKFYPYPKTRLDAVYVGPYLKHKYNRSPIYRHTRIAVGFMGGYKVLLPKRFYFEIGAGVGMRVHSALRNNVGEFIDSATNTNVINDIVDFFSDSVGKLDITSRITFGYRLAEYKGATKTEKIITP